MLRARVLRYLGGRSGSSASSSGVVPPSASGLAGPAGGNYAARLELPHPAVQVLSRAELLVPALLTIIMAFNSGGFTGAAPAWLTAAMAVAVGLRLAITRPAPGLIGRAFVCVFVALCALALWTLVSSMWSDASWRAVREFDRTLLYLLVMLWTALASARADAARWLTNSLLAAFVLVCLAALAPRLFPDVWSVSVIANEKGASYPLTYSNALGLIAGLGTILALGVTAMHHEPRVIRALAAGCVPLCATTVMLTYSRGAIAVTVIGALVLVSLLRSRAVGVSAVAVAPATVCAVLVAYHADALAGNMPQAAAAIDDGRRVAIVLVACMLVAAVLYLAIELQARRLSPLRRPSRRVCVAVVGALVIAFVGLAAATSLPSRLEAQYDSFVQPGVIEQTGDSRDRLFESRSNGRIEQWEVAADAFEREPMTGNGAGTYELLWAQNRPIPESVLDAHSLYLEMLAELGLVGLALLSIALLAFLVALATGARAQSERTTAMLFAAAIAWVLAAGGDWHWEMPAVTLWMFAAGGLALARRVDPIPPVPRRPARPASTVRLAAAVVCLIVAVTPARVALAEMNLDDSVEAFKRGDCASASESAQAASTAPGSQPDAHDVIAYCHSVSGEPVLAVRSAQAAVDEDPENWRYHYALALVRGTHGLDPRPAIRRARALNPREQVAIGAARQLVAERPVPGAWRRRVATFPLTLPP